MIKQDKKDAFADLIKELESAIIKNKESNSRLIRISKFLSFNKKREVISKLNMSSSFFHYPNQFFRNIKQLLGDNIEQKLNDLPYTNRVFIHYILNFEPILIRMENQFDQLVSGGQSSKNDLLEDIKRNIEKGMFGIYLWNYFRKNKQIVESTLINHIDQLINSISIKKSKIYLTRIRFLNGITKNLSPEFINWSKINEYNDINLAFIKSIRYLTNWSFVKSKDWYIRLLTTLKNFNYWTFLIQSTYADLKNDLVYKDVDICNFIYESFHDIILDFDVSKIEFAKKHIGDSAKSEDLKASEWNQYRRDKVYKFLKRKTI